MRYSARAIFSTGFVFGVAASLALPMPQAHAGTIQVTPYSMGNWTFTNSDGNGTSGANPTGVGAMVTGPATPPLGAGSANLATGNGTTGGDGGELLSTTDYDATSISAITALSYFSYATQNNGSQFPFLQLFISTGLGGANAYDQLVFEPPYQTPGSGNPSLPDQGTPTLNTWQSWNALAGGWYDGDGLCGSPGTGVVSWTSCISNFPTATIVDPSALGFLSGVGGLTLQVGFASATDQFNGYVDALTVGIGGANKTYDFDPVPEPATLPVLAFALAAFGLLRYRSRAS